MINRSEVQVQAELQDSGWIVRLRADHAEGGWGLQADGRIIEYRVIEKVEELPGTPSRRGTAYRLSIGLTERPEDRRFHVW